MKPLKMIIKDVAEQIVASTDIKDLDRMKNRVDFAAHGIEYFIILATELIEDKTYNSIKNDLVSLCEYFDSLPIEDNNNYLSMFRLHVYNFIEDKIEE
ncbi:hypothetical protein [uncultured Bacteroides sp.]|uniref:hypothetical protein n=1 Tax=uncultured Bacteroides sp. TaxID=162156 RepID=UPI002AA6BE90|nr:hypothetical protein [uncultured Bacteroides sp.]